MSSSRLASKRPAETATGFLGLVSAALIVFFGMEPEKAAILAGLLGFVPAGVTYLVELVRAAKQKG